jgi:thiamine biosynthesis protein ThiI
MVAVSSATSLPILRPLLTYEKNETVELAKAIGSFGISTRAYKDCCSLFVTKHPATKARLEIVNAIERKLNLNEAIRESVENTEMINVE